MVHSGAGGAAWSLTLVYATDLFDKATARVLGEQFVRVLDGVTADPAIAVGDVAVLDAAGEREILAASAGLALDVASRPSRTWWQPRCRRAPARPRWCSVTARCPTPNSVHG